eukprot:13651226-Alexandrium_andersonii.AAC.1
MSASLVGSEMCIRDRAGKRAGRQTDRQTDRHARALARAHARTHAHRQTCLLYTSDAADDM